MLYLYTSLLFALLHVYAGLGLTLLLAPAPLRKHVLFLSPMVGYCTCTLAGWYCHLADLRGTDRYGPGLLVLPAVLLYVALVRRGTRAEVRVRLLDKESGAALALGVLVFLVVSMPMVRNPDGLTTISLGNNDVATSSTAARYIKEVPRSEPFEFLHRGVNDYVYPPEIRFGTALATALPSSLFSLETYQLENIAATVFFFFAVLLVHSLAREGFRYTHPSALAVAACCGLSPVLSYTIYQGFGSQIIAMALGLALLLVLLQAMEHGRTVRDALPYLVLAALLNWGFVVTYRHMLPFLYVPLVGYLLLVGRRFPERSLLFPRLAGIFAAVALGFLLSPSRAWSFLAYFTFMGGAAAGWHMPLLSPDTLMGLTFTRTYLQALPDLWSGLSWGAGIALVVLGLRRVSARDPRVARLAASCVVLVLAGTFALAVVGRGEAGWGGYRSYKFVSFFLPQILLGSLVLFSDLELPPRTARERALAVALLALLAGNLVSAWRSAEEMARVRRAVGHDLVDLERIESDDRVASINIRGTDIWDMMWQANFLARKPLYFGPGTYYQPTALEGAWDLERSSAAGGDILRVQGFEENAVIRVNATYSLEKTGAVLRARLGRGWYDAEQGHRWAGDGDRAGIVLQTAKALGVDVEARYWPLDPANRLSAYLNGDRVATCGSNDTCRIDGIVLPRGESLLEFAPALPSARPANGDARRLAYAFSSITLCPSKSRAPAATAATTAIKIP